MFTVIQVSKFRIIRLDLWGDVGGAQLIIPYR